MKLVDTVITILLRSESTSQHPFNVAKSHGHLLPPPINFARGEVSTFLKEGMLPPNHPPPEIPTPGTGRASSGQGDRGMSKQKEHGFITHSTVLPKGVAAGVQCSSNRHTKHRVTHIQIAIQTMQGLL